MKMKDHYKQKDDGQKPECKRCKSDVASLLIYDAMNSSHSNFSPDFNSVRRTKPYTITEIIRNRLCQPSDMLELDLSNSCIAKVEGLEILKQIQRLNLSFNSIRKIEGLDQLCHLRWLSFYHNHIADATGLDSCISLKFLSIGQNIIRSIMHVCPYLQHLRHLRDLNLKGNPCMIEDENGSLDVPKNVSRVVQCYLPSLVYFNDVKISKPTIQEENHLYMSHSRSYYNVLSILNETASTGSKQLQVELTYLYHIEPKLSYRINDENNIEIEWKLFQQELESIWADYTVKVSEQKLIAFKSISCHHKYLIDIEQEQLEALSNLSNVDEIKVDGWIEKEISFGEKLSMKLIDTLNTLSEVQLQIKDLQHICMESMGKLTERQIDVDHTDERNAPRLIFHDQIRRRFDECNKHLIAAEKEMTAIANTWYFRHRARFLEVSKLRQ